MSEVNTPSCGRENDLISYLYGELNEVEGRFFQRHLNECATCNTELASFGIVRESVVTWRNESIGNIGLPVQTTSPANAAARVRPSAIAALREFFTLSPLWMKGAVAFAAILFCIFAGLAVARLENKPPVTTAHSTVAPGRSPQEFNALVDQRVKDELNRIKAQEQQSKDLLARDNTPQKNSPKGPVNRSKAMPVNYSQNARRPLSRTEREQLAADLRLAGSKGDSDIDLLEERINQ